MYLGPGNTVWGMGFFFLDLAEQPWDKIEVNGQVNEKRFEVNDITI